MRFLNGVFTFSLAKLANHYQIWRISREMYLFQLWLTFRSVEGETWVSANDPAYSATEPHRWEGEELEPLTKHNVLHSFGRNRQFSSTWTVDMSCPLECIIKISRVSPLKSHLKPHQKMVVVHVIVVCWGWFWMLVLQCFIRTIMRP